ncbi:hypothetical protein MLD38_023795 [Melastoma candidum]|uniref:Uncharacterized protein n=1 Tax=Melastoma candidum TaxID=119954 RepID=A0ACB9NR88_9MYRT|nr:hypothetical protein MLD38_023795 [Melastoma candidum]
MGCAASKIDNEDVVRRCKERSRLIKDAVFARHHLAGAHSDYSRSLRLTGSALSSFASHEPLPVSLSTPAALLRRAPNPNPNPNPNPTPPPSSSSFRAPPPPSPSPPPPTPPVPPSSSGQRLLHDNPTRSGAYGRSKPAKFKVRLPHILSESSPNSSPPRGASASAYPTAYIINNKGNNGRSNGEDDYDYGSTYASTPSQASSVWNWENFYPPSPPDSEYFNRRANDIKEEEGETEEEEWGRQRQQPSGYELDEGGETTSMSEYDFFDNRKQRGSANSVGRAGSQKFAFDERSEIGRSDVNKGGKLNKKAEAEEVQCSEWGDHDYDSITSSSEDHEGDEEDNAMRSEVGTVDESAKGPTEDKRSRKEEVEVEKKPEVRMKSSTMSYGRSEGGSAEEVMRMVVRHKDLKEIVDAIRENFDLAAASGDQVSEMLEIGRAQMDKSFSQLKKTVYHSTSMLSTLSATWTSKPPLAVKYRFDADSLEVAGGQRSLCSTLDRLLAWEKKLYQEVKAREGVKIEHEKKLAALQSQEYKGEEQSKLDKTKASIKRLQSLIIVTSQAVSTTSTAITGLRDSDLVPQLVELCHGFMYMWRSMHQYHEIQNVIVQQVRGLVNCATKGQPTSELHRQATRDLESAVSAWHSSFCRLIKFQRDFIRSLHGWFRLTLLPVDNDNNGGNREHSDAYAFCDEWKLALDRVPDTVASEAIKSFINVVHVISVKQSEEMKVKKGTETASKELEKKASSLRNIEKKYYHSYSMVGIGMPDTGPDSRQVLDARDPLSEKKSELAACQRRVEDEMLRHSKAVEVTRAMTLNNLQTGLPGVFQALTSFSSLFTEALEAVCTRSYAIK